MQAGKTVTALDRFIPNRFAVYQLDFIAQADPLADAAAGACVVSVK